MVALVGGIACAVVLPFAVATAGSERDRAETAADSGRGRDGISSVSSPAEPGGGRDDGKASGPRELPTGGGTASSGAGRAADGTYASTGGTGPGDSGNLGDSRYSKDSSGFGDPTDFGDLGDFGDGSKGRASASGRSVPTLGEGLATAVRCGPELTSPEGIEAQTCVLAQGTEIWARTYYRNVTGGPLDAVLSLLGTGGRTVQTRCAVSAEDEPGSCETPRERIRGAAASYTAVAEFANRAGYGPLLLRTGSG